jgi:hypothetical protein
MNILYKNIKLFTFILKNKFNFISISRYFLSISASLHKYENKLKNLSLRVKKEVIEKKMSNLKTSSKSIKLDSHIYNRLLQYIKHAGVNETTQMEIETFLFNLGIKINSETNIKDSNLKNTDINYNLISNKLTKLFLKEKDKLNNIINNFRQLNVKKKLINNKYKAQYYLYKLLSESDNEEVISLILGRLITIISIYYNKQHIYKNDIIDILHEIHNDMFNKYIYNLYIKEKKLNKPKSYTLNE